MKQINELTEKEAQEILEYIYPGKTPLSNPKKYEYWFEKLSFKVEPDKDGKYQVGFDMRPLVGIIYKNDMGDGCRIHFDDIKVISWLYQHGYDITKQLKNNEYLREFENDMDEASYMIHCLAKGKESHLFNDVFKNEFSLEFYINQCKKIEEYFYKDYN